jgi:cell wall-associated NlpC family hydrolase
MRFLVFTMLALRLLAGCSSAPPYRPEPVAAVVSKADAVGARAAALATRYVGVPYRLGGHSPAGFDCSGLVWFVYHELGISVPRTAALQHQVARSISGDQLQPGDLVFFYTSVDHVGIYVGNGEFIHAPATGKTVSRARLNSPYFILGFAGGGRLPGA